MGPTETQKDGPLYLIHITKPDGTSQTNTVSYTNLAGTAADLSKESVQESSP